MAGGRHAVKQKDGAKALCHEVQRSERGNWGRGGKEESGMCLSIWMWNSIAEKSGASNQQLSRMETNNKNIVPPCLRHYFNNNHEVNLLTNHEINFFLHLKILIWKRDMSSPTRQRESNESLYYFILFGRRTCTLNSFCLINNRIIINTLSSFPWI